MSTQQIIEGWENGVEPYTMRRLLIRNRTHFVNFADTFGGLLMAKAFRRSHPQFKRRRIKPILQMKPKDIPLGEIMPLS